MLNPEIGFIGNTSNGSMLGEENANLPAGQYHIATTRLLALSKLNRHSDAPYRKSNQAQRAPEAELENPQNSVENCAGIKELLMFFFYLSLPTTPSKNYELTVASAETLIKIFLPYLGVCEHLF